MVFYLRCVCVCVCVRWGLTGNAYGGFAALGRAQVTPGHAQAPVILGAVEILHLLPGDVYHHLAHLQTWTQTDREREREWQNVQFFFMLSRKACQNTPHVMQWGPLPSTAKDLASFYIHPYSGCFNSKRSPPKESYKLTKRCRHVTRRTASVVFLRLFTETRF